MKKIHLEEVDSTNKYLKDNYESLEGFTFVSTDFQTNGKGRESRMWFSNKNENLLFSFLLKDKNLLEKYKALSLGTATLIARFLEILGLKNVQVKWPNDVYVNNKKICGILLEGDVSKYLVIGVGLNVNQTEFLGEYRVTPTSIFCELNKLTNIDELKENLFSFIYKHFNQRLFVKNTKDFFAKHDYLKGKNVSVNGNSGIANGIDEDFNLIIGKNIVSSGEVNFKK